MAGTAHEPDDTGTFALFESGDCKRVHASLHFAGKDRGRPVDGYVVTEGQGDFTRAARRAAQAVYAIAKKHFPAGGPVSVAYDLEGLSSGVTLTGESAGLAFAIELSKRLYKHKRNPGPVAATGQITGGADSETVGAVSGIKEKLEAALRELPRGGWVLCPKVNEEEITDSLRMRIKEKGLKLRTVSSVSEALKILFSTVDPPPKRKTIWIVLVIVLLCAGALGAVLWFGYRNPPGTDETTSTTVSTNTVVPETTSVPTTEKAQLADKPVIVSLTGDTLFTTNLAGRLTDRLTDFLRRQYQAASLTMTGIVSTVKIMEETDAVTGSLQAEMGVAVKDLVLEVDGRKKTFELLSVTVKGTGSAGALIPAAADRLYQGICARIANRPEKKKPEAIPSKKKKIKGGKGFE